MYNIFTKALNNTDISGVFKRNGLTIKLDGSEDHLVFTIRKALVWDEMKQFRSKLLTTLHPPNLKRLKMIIPPDGVKRKLDEVAEGVLLDEGEETLDGEVEDEEWVHKMIRKARARTKRIHKMTILVMPHPSTFRN